MSSYLVYKEFQFFSVNALVYVALGSSRLTIIITMTVRDYSRTSVARTLMARLPQQDPIAADFG